MDALKSNLLLKHLDKCFLLVLKTPTLNKLEVMMRRNYHIVEKKKVLVSAAKVYGWPVILLSQVQ